MRSLSPFLISLALLLVLSSFGHAFQKTLEYRDRTYEATINTVQLYPQGNSVQSALVPAVKDINGGANLVLQFDDIKEDADYYYVRFEHCNSDWSPSDLRANMIVEGYNEFEIEDFEFSTESKISYVHYRFTFPTFKKTGNFVAIVYRNQDKKDIVLTKRFMIYRNRAGVGARITRSTTVEKRLSNQRIEVSLNYGSLQGNDPRENFKVVVRQNQRWDNAKFDLPITYIDENAKSITYRNMGESNDFAGGNEFRFFDLSTVNFTGRNVDKVKFVGNRATANIVKEKELSAGYLQNLDLNGQYYIRDSESNIGNGITQEYVETTFSLAIPEQRYGIYILGAFNQWRRDQSNKMAFDKEAGAYKATLRFKQGWYDYSYWLDDPLDPYQIDRSFFDTENEYEVFVYFRGMGSRGDELVGYTRLTHNRRR